EMGVEIHYGEPVESMEFSGKRITSVTTSKATYSADATVVNADLARAMTRLVPDELRRRWSDKKIASRRFSCSTFMLYLGLDGCYESVPHHNIYLAENYREALADIERRHRLSRDPSMYVQNASVTDPSLAPPGMSTLYVLIPVSHKHPNINWEKEAPAFREVAINQLEKIGIENVRPRIRYEKMITPDDWQEDYAIYRGATFNLSHDLNQMLHMRPHNRFEDIDGMYLVGGGTHPGSGLPVIYSSAKITTDLLLRDLDIATETSEPAEHTNEQWRTPEAVPAEPIGSSS
ncbi:MAG: phytoene desaturase family protein, partial [Pirellulales bacterium]